MAVKQVDLPSGDARNEEKKRSTVQALEREIELLRELQHENIVQYLGELSLHAFHVNWDRADDADSATDGNNLYIFLEYVPGGSVAALLSSYGAFEEALVRNFSRQILTGLNYLHERNIIHRDIKGANILVDNKGGIKISDFGISKKTESSEWSETICRLTEGLMERPNRPSLQGSVFWMAPEVVKQTSYTSKADIWSVGCLVVEMLTGTHPWADLTQMQAIFRVRYDCLLLTPRSDHWLALQRPAIFRQTPPTFSVSRSRSITTLDPPHPPCSTTRSSRPSLHQHERPSRWNKRTRRWRLLPRPVSNLCHLG